MALYQTITQSIHKGESQLFGVTLLKSDGSALLFSDLQTGTKIELYQNNSLIATLLLASDTLREGDTANELEIELLSSVTALFSSGYPVFLRLYAVATNADYTSSSGEQTDIKTYKIENVL